MTITANAQYVRHFARLRSCTIRVAGQADIIPSVDAIVKLPAAVRARFEDRIRDWRIVVEQVLETESSVIAFGTRGQQHVVLKVIKHSGDEWDSGRVLDAYKVKGVLRVTNTLEGQCFSNA